MSDSGLVGLFFSGLISATLLPGGSEVLYAWMLSQQQYPWLLLWLTVTAGNSLGGFITYGMGWWLARFRPSTMFNKPTQQRARLWLERYGPLALLLSWLPLVGDPLCLLAGWLRTGFLFSLLMITLGKAMRYLLISGVF